MEGHSTKQSRKIRRKIAKLGRILNNKIRKSRTQYQKKVTPLFNKLYKIPDKKGGSK